MKIWSRYSPYANVGNCFSEDSLNYQGHSGTAAAITIRAGQCALLPVRNGAAHHPRASEHRQHTPTDALTCRTYKGYEPKEPSESVAGDGPHHLHQVL